MNQPAHPAFGPAAASAVPGAFPVRAAAQQPPRPGRPAGPGVPGQRPQGQRPPAPPQPAPQRPQPAPPLPPQPAQRPPTAQRPPQTPQQRPQVAPPLRPVQRPESPQRPQAPHPPAARAPQRPAAPARPAAPPRAPQAAPARRAPQGAPAPAPVPAGLPPAPPVIPAQPEPLGPPPRPRKRKIGGWVALLVIMGGIGGAAWYGTHTAPAAAGVGDCLAQTGGNDLAKVGCGDPSATFTVVGKLENKTMVDASLDACTQFPKATSSYWEGKSGELGLVLCLAPVEPVAAPKK